MEKKIEPYPIDGYCKETDTVYEFQGCLDFLCMDVKNVLMLIVTILCSVNQWVIYIKCVKKEQGLLKTLLSNLWKYGNMNGMN